ncbi:PfkB family carbohydrate kinase [Nocardia carnea]|uniref:PfkB family carbohydrate kinase n=1 Tax=Nocardia carnea TaxID=37328 RepID=UPI002453F9F3|nr:PfkB family carbohydrate kinase [Nocardia carnea]
MSGRRAHVVVIGGGYAGIAAANRLRRRAGIDITVVNPRPEFVERIQLHQLAAGTGSATAAYDSLLGAGRSTRSRPHTDVETCDSARYRWYERQDGGMNQDGTRESPKAGLFAGISTVDIAYLVDGYPAEDTKTQARDQFIGAGGPAANAAVAYAALGGAPVLVTAVGAHRLGDLIRNDLSAHGVRVVDVRADSDHQPPVSSIVVAESAATRTIVSLDGARIAVEYDHRLAGLLADVNVVLVDGHYPALAAGLCERARSLGIPTVLDAGRFKDPHTALLPHIRSAICSAAFAPPGIRPGDTAAVLAYLRTAGVENIAITNGGTPIIGLTGDREFRIDIPETHAVDTLGAGDILHGAFCYYTAAGHDFVRALTLASKVASFSCRFFGTREWCARLSELPGRGTPGPEA